MTQPRATAPAVLTTIIVATAIVLPGCAATSSAWAGPFMFEAAPSAGPIFVMEPLVAGAATPGNVGRDLVAIRHQVAERLLSIVKERFPAAKVVTAGPLASAAMRQYQQAAGVPVVTVEEQGAASEAAQQGASHLLVATISEWTEMRADDPIGAMLGPHNSVTISLRLMRLDPPALAGSVTFHNRARLTLNRHALGLLNDDFTRTVRQLIGASPPSLGIFDDDRRFRSPMIASLDLFETHLTVADLHAAIDFYRDVVGLRLAHVTPDGNAAFMWIGAAGESMLGLWAAGPAPLRLTSHAAFRVSAADVMTAPQVLRAAGVTPLDFSGRPTDAPVVLAWMPAAAVYFHDPDGNLLEFIAMLPDMPQPELGVLPWRMWDFIHQPAAAHAS